MGRRRDYDEGYEDARREMREREEFRSRGDGSFTAAVIVKYVAIIIVVIIIAYVILTILNSVLGIFAGPAQPTP